MKAKKVLTALAVLLPLIGAPTAHAKSLTTATSGLSFGIECHALNVSKTRSIRVNFIIRSAFGAELARLDNHELAPLTRHLLGSNGAERWCEFEIVAGPAKDLRASMHVFDPGFGEIATIEPAR